MVKNDTILCWLRKGWLAILILGIVIAIVAVYADLPEQVEANTTRSTGNKEAIIRIETHYEHIVKSLDQINRELQNGPR